MRTTLTKRNQDLLVLVTDAENESAELVTEGLDTSVLTISGFDWNKDLSPWFAPKVFKKGEDFEGKADDLIAEILALPELNQSEWNHMYICGYSLAGLFALYMTTKCDLFDGFVCASGSLWFPDFISYLKDHPAHVTKAYFSLGDKEKNAKNPIMARVEDCTKEAEKMVYAYAETTFELNPGNHFIDAEKRMRKGIDWLLK